MRGPAVMAGYDSEPAGRSGAVQDGWLYTGDILRREADGSYTYLRRAGDRFKAGALWVDAARVREALLRHEEVDDAVVLPVHDPGRSRAGRRGP